MTPSLLKIGEISEWSEDHKKSNLRLILHVDFEDERKCTFKINLNNATVTENKQNFKMIGGP